MNQAYQEVYNHSMDELHFTAEQKAQIAANAVNAVCHTSQETTTIPIKTQRKRRPIGKAALIAACLAMALTVGAGATGMLKPVTDIFAPLLGGSPAQTEIINKIGHPISASSTDSGITITADAIIGDEYNAVIVYSIQRDDGQPILPEEARNSFVSLHGFSTGSWKGGTHGSSWIKDEDPTDNKLQYIEAFSSDTPLSHGTITADFRNLYYYTEAEENQTLYTGHWNLKFDVNYEDSSILLDGGKTFTQDDIQFTIDKISVSPIAVQVYYTADKQVVWDKNATSGRQSDSDTREMQRYLENIQILLTKTDGSVIDLSNAGGSIEPENGKTICSKGEVLSEIVPLEEMASISIGGVVYDIPSQTN